MYLVSNNNWKILFYRYYYNTSDIIIIPSGWIYCRLSRRNFYFLRFLLLISEEKHQKHFAENSTWDLMFCSCVCNHQTNETLTKIIFIESWIMFLFTLSNETQSLLLHLATGISSLAINFKYNPVSLLTYIYTIYYLYSIVSQRDTVNEICASLVYKVYWSSHEWIQWI